jgi:hypothetical protein
MDFDLTDDQRLLREEVIRFARRELNDGAGERDRDQTFSRDLWRKCGEMGLQGLPVPETLGGTGLDALTCAIALEAFGYACTDGGLVFSVGAHLLSCVIPVWRFGTDAQKERYLPGICNGAIIGAHAMTEPGSGSDAFSMRTTAVREGDGWRIDGTKMFVSNGPVADVAVTFAVTSRERGFLGGLTTFLVETSAAGVHVNRKIDKMGLRSSPLGELVFDGVVVNDDAVLGGVGGGSRIFVHSMDWERICLFAAHVGTAQRILERAIEHARTRTQFGQAIGKFQAVAHRLADLKVSVEAARLLVYRAAWQLKSGRSASLDAAMAKLFASETLLRTTLDAVRTFGGYGFMTEYEIERALRDAVGSTLYSGTSDMQRNTIARWLGL